MPKRGADTKAPAFQFYAKDFLVDTQLMSNAEVGAYVRLLAYAWVGLPGHSQATLPRDHGALARLVGESPAAFTRLWQAIEPCFEATDSSIRHRRLVRELEQQQAHAAERSEAGTRGALARWQQHGSAMAQPSNADGSANGSATQEVMAKNGSASASATADQIPPLAPPPAGGAPGRRRRRHGRDIAPVAPGCRSEAWERLSEAVRLEVGPKSWQAWFACCAPLEERGEVLVVGCPNELIRAWIERNFREALDEATARVAPGVRVRLVSVQRDAVPR